MGKKIYPGAERRRNTSNRASTVSRSSSSLAAARPERTQHAHMHTHKLTCAQSYRLSSARVIQPATQQSICPNVNTHKSFSLHFLDLDIVFVSESRSGTRNWSSYLHTLFIDSSDCIMCELLTEFLRYAKWEEERSVLRPAMSALSFCCFGCRKTDFLFLSMTRAIFMLDRYRDHSCSHIDLNMLI